MSADLDDFDYGRWLLGQGYDFKSRREETPLFWDYVRFQRGNIARYMGELADYTREYARSAGRDVLVSGNFFNLFDHYYAMEPFVDVIITEMRNTTYRQPSWYRYAAGFAAGKPLVVVENPYGGVVPELVAALARGRGYDRFRQSLYEAAALGVNMSLPYGSWMGSVIEDAFYAPDELCREVGAFLAQHDNLYSRQTWAETGIIYSVESNFQAMARRDLFQDNRVNSRSTVEVPFWQACDAMSDAAQPYDVLFFPEGTLRADTLTIDDLAQYQVLVAPAVRFLTGPQAALLEAFLQRGGRLLVHGAFGLNLAEERRRRILGHPGTTAADGPFGLAHLPDGPQVTVRTGAGTRLAVNPQRVADGVALHFIRYDYDEDADRVPPLPELTLEIRLAETFSTVRAVGIAGGFTASVERADDGRHRIRMTDVPLYGIVVLGR